MGADLAVWHFAPQDMALASPGMTPVLAARPESLSGAATRQKAIPFTTRSWAHRRPGPTAEMSNEDALGRVEM